MEELSQIVKGKGLILSTKELLCLTKAHSANSEGQVEIKCPSPETLFHTNDLNKKKKIKKRTL